MRNIFILLAILVIVMQISCNGKPKSPEIKQEPHEISEKKLLSNKNEEQESSNWLKLKKDCPVFEYSEFNRWTADILKYTQEMTLAMKKNNLDEALKIQQKLVELNAQYLKMNDKLSNTDRNTLRTWYDKVIALAKE